jgi:hypothetical protein
MTNALRPTLLLISSLLAASAAETLETLSRTTFNEELATSGWHVYAWSRSLENIPVSIVPGDGGKVLQLSAVDAGAAGAVSRSWTIGEADLRWQVTFRVKRTDGYIGNQPWCFAAASDEQGAFVPPAVPLTPKVTVTDNWQTQVLSVARSQLPAGSKHLTINLTTAADKTVTAVGALLIDDVQIDVVR